MSTKLGNAVVYHSVPDMLKANLPTHVTEFATRVFGPADAIQDLSSPVGPARVYRWDGAAAHGFVKVYASPRPYRQERDAYERWIRQLPYVPTLLDATAHPAPKIALTALPGEPVAERDLGAARERALHESAGSWLRRLHELPHDDDDPVGLADALRLRWSPVWEHDSDGLAPKDLRRWVGRILQAAVVDIGGTRVPCHRDFQPANWLADAAGEWIGVIDFEHTRSDHPLADVARLAAYVWPHRPDLEAAFRAGYGGRPHPGDAFAPFEESVRVFAVAEAWHRWLWAHRHRDLGLGRSAARALAALGAPVEPDDLAYPDP